MKRTHKIAAGIAASVSLGLAAAVFAQQGPMGGTGPHAQGGMQHGMKGGMQHGGAQAGAQHGMKGGMGPGATGHGPAGQAAGHGLMTPEERTALREKMRNAATPEERQKIAEATRAEMQKRAQERGVTLPEHRGAHFGTPRAPATN
jgi:hypothetical protein